MNRFFISSSVLRGEQVVLGSQQAHQIRNVLRMGPGDHIIVLDNAGAEYEVVLADIGKDQVVGRIIEQRPAAGEPALRITLYQGLLSRDKFEWVLQKCTEVGVARFVPVVTQRSCVRKVEAVTPNKLTRWRRIITEAAEQSARGRIPELASPVNFADALSGLKDFDRTLIASPQSTGRLTAERRITLRKALRHTGDKTLQSVALLIGPEGGFAEQEVRLASDSGAVPLGLGPRILRTETAAVVASALVLYESDQMET